MIKKETKTINRSPKLDDISFLKTAMMIAVVFCHSLAFFGGQWFNIIEPVQSAKYLGLIADWMGTFHVQAFTMASGFLFYYLKKNNKKKNSLRREAKKRARRLLLPYLFVSILWVIPIGWHFFKWSIKEIICKFILMVAPAQLWFLIMLFVVSLFFLFFGSKIKVSTKNLIILLIATTAISATLSYYKLNIFQLSKAAQYILYFYLGGYIFYNKEKITTKQSIIMAFLAITIYIGLQIMNASTIGFLKYVSTAALPFISVLEVSAIYYICNKLIRDKRINVNSKLYKVLEENSFGVYLFHQQIIYFTIIWLNGAIHPIIQVILSFVISMATSLIMTLLLRKTKPTRIMFGL